MDLRYVQGEVKILLVASCYRNRDKLLPDGPLGLYEDLPTYHCHFIVISLSLPLSLFVKLIPLSHRIPIKGESVY